MKCKYSYKIFLGLPLMLAILCLESVSLSKFSTGSGGPEVKVDDSSVDKILTKLGIDLRLDIQDNKESIKITKSQLEQDIDLLEVKIKRMESSDHHAEHHLESEESDDRAKLEAEEEVYNDPYVDFVDPV